MMQQQAAELDFEIVATHPIPFDVRCGTRQRALLLSILLVEGVARAADPLSEALQQGLLAEEVRQDLDAAIAAYQSVVVDQHDAQRRWVATELFPLGESYRKQGKHGAEVATSPPDPAQTGPAAERDIPSAADPVNP
jgi:hypothetical protein